MSACTKTAYASAREARRAMRALADRLYAYKCDRCGKWHLANGERAARDWVRRERWAKAGRRTG